MQPSFWLSMAPLLIGVVWMFFYVIYRWCAIFSFYPSKWILWIISFCSAAITFFTVRYAWNNVFITVLWTIFSRLLVSCFLLFFLFWIEHIISIRYKINKWIVLGVVLVFFATWIFFSLHTKVVTLDIQSDKIEKDLKILLVSDIHVDYVLSTHHLKTIGQLIEKEKPDMVIIAWDLLNRPHPWYVDAYTYFQKNSYGVPMIAIMWNHDVMWARDVYQKISEVSPIIFLDNQSIKIDWIQIVWIVDKSVRGEESLNNNISETSMDNSGEIFTILMTHQPIALEKLKDYAIDLEVAWHTHRGQIYWFRKIVELMNDYDYWLFKEDWKMAYVTQWIWTWGLPFRLWTQSEAVIINLKK